MGRATSLVTVGLLALTVATPLDAAGLDAAGRDAAERFAADTQDVLVQLEDGASVASLVRAVTHDGGRITRTYRHAIRGLAAQVPADVAAALESDPRVARIEADAPVEALQTPTGIRRIGADEYPPADIDGDGSTIDVDVAILDTGVDGAHPDLLVSGGVDCLAGACTAVDDPVDPHGHGTHIAGTAAARDDGAGVVGVAPGARIHSVRVLDGEGSGTLSSLLAGLDWLQANAERIEVANLSLGCDCQSTTFDDAVRAVSDAGVTMVVAAGNAGQDAGSSSPANHPDVITVAAMSDYDGLPGRRALLGCITDADDSFATYSNYGAVVDLVAPGSCIRSTVPGGGYGRSSGTSMAAPHVAGAAALHIATADVARSVSRPAQVREALVDRFSVASTDECGYTDSKSVAPMLHLTCAEFTANADPTLDVASPDDGSTVVSGQTVALRATARDAEDASLDEDILWSSSVDGVLGSGPSLDVVLDELGDHTIVASVSDSSGSNVRDSRMVRVTTDSGSTGSSTGGEPSVPQEPEPEEPPSTDRIPELTVIAPVPQGQLVADRDVQLVSRAVDAEDGDIRAWVRWRSDRDGELGVGGTFAARLSAGTHRLTASVRDTADNLVERTASVTVAAPQELGARSITGGCPPDHVEDAGFDDVDATNAHADAADCVAWWGVTEGVGDGSYGVARPVTRGQMATFLAAVIERSGASLAEPSRDHFADDDGTTHERNINRLAAAGVVSGTAENRYSPNASVTREQMATFLVRTYEHRAQMDLPAVQARFDDVTSVHATNVDATAAAGIAAGLEAERYGPGAAVRRDQMASFIARTLDLLVDVNVAAPPQ